MILSKFRDASNGIVIKILFGAIILSFCLWGVGDIIRNYSASKSVFSIDKHRVTVEQFLREYSQEKQRIRNIGSKPLSDEEMKSLDIPNIVLDRLINEAVFEKTCENLGLITSKRTITAIIMSLPEFQKNGVFDQRAYENALRHSSLSEAGFLNQIRGSIARNQLIHPLVAGYRVPNVVKEIMAKEFEARNTVVLAKVNAKDMKYNKEITNEEVYQYYLNNQEKYKKPEQRDLAILVVDYSKLSGDIEVDEDEVSARYIEYKDSYVPTEKRDFERFIFEDKESADRAWNLINRGTSTAEIVKKFKPDMETVREMDISQFPTTIGKSLFDLKKGKTSDVYASGGKFYIYKLVGIHKARALNDAELKEKARAEIRNEKMNSPEFYAHVKELKNKIDDGFGSGKTIEEIANETGMEVRYIKGEEKSYNSTEFSKIVKDEDTRSEVIDAAFETEEMQATTMIDSRETDTLSYVVFVQKVKKSEIPQFEQISEEVRKDYVLEQKDKIALDKINEILNSEEKVADKVLNLKNSRSFKLSKMDLLRKQEDQPKVVSEIVKILENPNIAMNIISTLGEGEASYYKISDGEYLVFGITKIDRSRYSSGEATQLIYNYFDRAASNDVLPIAMEGFKKFLKIKIDNKLINEVVKAEDEREESTNE